MALMIKRIDPPDCDCTDCITGYSKPINFATEHELGVAFYCPKQISNASGAVIKRELKYIYEWE